MCVLKTLRRIMKKDKGFKQVLFLFKICYLMYVLLAFNAFVNGTAWMNKASYVITVLGIGGILWMIFCYKRYKKAYNVWLLGAFVVSYLISAVTHLSYGVTENVKGMIWLVLPLVLVYVGTFDMSGTEIRREMRILSGIYIFYCTIANLISLSMVYWGRMYDHIDDMGVAHGIGYRWNRLWGVYDDPNHGATITVVALFMLIYLFCCAKKLWQRCVCILIIIVNYLYVVLSDSRTGMISLGGGILLCGLLLFCMKIKQRAHLKRAFVPLACVVVITGITFASDAALKLAYQPIEQKIVQQLEEKKKIVSQPKNNKNNVRKSELKKDYTNGRMEIWKNGLQIAQKSPVVGVGYRNIAQYAKVHFPEGYLAKNDSGVKYDSMHNLELDVLVGQGILGITICILLAGNILFILYKKVHQVPAEYHREFVFSATIAGTLVVAGTFLSFIFYVNAPQNICFWLFLGYAMRFCQIGVEKEA